MMPKGNYGNRGPLFPVFYYNNLPVFLAGL